jgi:hypothetical protein
MSPAMSDDDHVYGEVNNEDDLGRIFAEIRRDIKEASSREELTKLYRRAEYLVTLTASPAWQKKFGSHLEVLRQVAREEFTETARAVNQRAREIGVPADYDEVWGED